MPEGAFGVPGFDIEASVEELVTHLDQSSTQKSRGALPVAVVETAKAILAGVKDAFGQSQIVEVPLKVVEQAQELGRILKKENYQLRDVFHTTVWLRRTAARMLSSGIEPSGRSATEQQSRLDRWFDDIVFSAINAFYEAQRNDLQKRIVVDGLTGVFNRTYLGERLAEEIERGRRYSHPVTLLMVDVDSMKPVNDRYGHRAGDAVLKSVSRVLRVQSRSVDVVARYGGDEFAVIMPQTGPEGAWALAERIAKGVSEVQPEGLRDLVTVSIGIASFPRDASTAEGLVDAADKALYRSKGEGGNTIAAFSSKVVADFGGRGSSHEAPPMMPDGGRQARSVASGDVKVWMDRARRLERQNLELSVSLGLARKKLTFYERLEGNLHEVLGETLRAAVEGRWLGDGRGHAGLDDTESMREQLSKEIEQLRAEREALRVDLARHRAEADRQLAAIRTEIDRLRAEERQAQVSRMELMEEIAALSKQRDLVKGQIENVLRQVGELPGTLSKTDAEQHA